MIFSLKYALYKIMWSETNLRDDSKNAMFLRFDKIRRAVKLWMILPSFLLPPLKKNHKKTTPRHTHTKPHPNFFFKLLLKCRQKSWKHMDFLQLNTEHFRRMVVLHFSNCWEVRFFKEFEMINAMDDASYLYDCVQLEKLIFSVPAPDILQETMPHKQKNQSYTRICSW